MFFIDTFDRDIVQAVIKDGGTRAVRATNIPPLLQWLVPQTYYYGAPGWTVQFEIVPHYQSAEQGPNFGRTLCRLADSEAAAMIGRGIALSDPSRIVLMREQLFLDTMPGDYVPPGIP